MHNNVSNNIVERCNEQIQLLAIHFFSTTDSGVDHHHSVRCTVTVYRLHIWIHCHGHNSIRYSDVYQQARTLAKSPCLPRQLRNDVLDLRWSAPLLLRRILRGAVSLTLRTQIWRPESKEQTFRKFYMKTKLQSNQQAMVASYNHWCWASYTNCTSSKTYYITEQICMRLNVCYRLEWHIMLQIHLCVACTQPSWRRR